MRSALFLLLVSLTLHNTSVVAGQRSAAEDWSEEAPDPLDEQLQEAETPFIRSLLMETGQTGNSNDADSRPAERVYKRQHPGKRSEGLEKRQHPGKREDRPDEEDTEWAVRGKRQHPGRRGADGRDPEDNAAPSKRQHPGKRFQLSGRRGWKAEAEPGESRALRKVRRPVRRYVETSKFPFACDLQDAVTCRKASYLLELLGDMRKSEGKRPHPGKRFASDEESEVRD